MDKKLAKFLRPTYGCESESSVIIKKLKEIIGNETNKRKIAEKLFDWVQKNIRYELDPIVGAAKLLERKTGACVDKSSLLIALCRAAGIPARYLIMIAYLLPKKSIDFTDINHCAVEIYINGGWKIVDPTFDPSLYSVFPKATFNSAIWWDKEKSKIAYRMKEIDKNLANVMSQSYEKDDLNLKFKELITKERI